MAVFMMKQEGSGLGIDRIDEKWKVDDGSRVVWRDGDGVGAGMVSFRAAGGWGSGGLVVVTAPA
jgi:hypothetical protein